ncbi:N(2)-fixation sustaining protein CowN [Azospirillum sp. ST 5-10]|uniref:N(2)-fixation sustaining protein CowN n=1 Tax=unclassified Azospirillum TaxID=2630922 RepID=UPI003F4A12C2
MDATDTRDPDTPDRYVSFKGIDCADNAARVVARLRRHIDDPAKTNAFWERFKEKLAVAGDPARRQADGLCLLCANVYYIADLFEEQEDEEGLALLRKLEDECC